MKKLHFSFLVLLCLITQSLAAQSWTACAVGEGEFFLYSVSESKFVTAGTTNGSRASLVTQGGIPLTFTAVDAVNGVYSISSEPTFTGRVMGIGSDGNEAYFDVSASSSSQYSDWKFIPVAGQENTYLIQAMNNNKYMVAHASKLDRTSVTSTSVPTTTKGYWKLVTKEALYATLATATKDNPVDATFAILNHTFAPSSSSKTRWTGDATAWDGSSDNKCVEQYNRTYEMYQTITDMPNGIYKMQCQGFYRMGGRSNARDNRNAGTEALNAKYYINNEERSLMSIFADDNATKAYKSGYNENSAYTVDGVNRYIPNTLSQAAQCFFAGYYLNEPIEVVVIDGTITVGFRKTVSYGSDWAAYDNVTLTYYGPDLSAIKEAALAQWDEYDALVVENGDRTTYDATLATIKSTIEDATDEAAISEAVRGLKPAYQIYQSSPEISGAPLNLTSMFTNADLKGGATGWTVTSTGGTPSFDTSKDPVVLEAYAGWDNLDMTAFKIEQTESITLAPGKYRLRVNAFYRYGVAYNSDGETPTSLAYMYAGDNRQEIMRLGDLANNEYPNSMSDASASFAAGNYLNSMLFTIDEPTTLKFGVDGTHTLKQSWFIMGPMTLEKVMENEALGEYMVRWEALKTITNQALDHNGFDATVEEGATATTESEMEAADAAVWSAFCNLLKTGTTATGQFDITSLVEGASTANAQEKFNQTEATVTHTIADMPAGTYTVKVQAFHRSHDYKTSSIAYENGTDVVAASLYFGDASTSVKNINDDARYISARRSSDVAGAYQRSVPNTLNGTDDAFNAGLYWNTLVATTDADGDIEFGLRLENGQTNNWMPYNNFRLYYGAAKTSVSLSTSEAYGITEATRADVTTNIALHAGEYNKVCLPFGLSATQVSATFSGAYALGGVTSDGEALTGQLVPVSTMEAGVGYFVTVAADKNLAVEDVLLTPAAPDSIPVIWDGAATVGNYTGYTFAINLPSEYSALASTLTYTPVDYNNVSFTTNLENWQARRFLNGPTYDQSSASKIGQYNQAPPSRRDQPHSVFIPVPSNSAALTLSVSLNSDYSNATTYDFAAGTTLCEVHNLVPQNTYYYKVEANEAIITKGQFNTEGRLRMIKATSGSNIRDLGGWQTIDGLRTNYGLVYRGGEMNAEHTLNAQDIQVLRALNIGGEVDLREDKDFDNWGGATLHEASALGNDIDYTYENLSIWGSDALQQVPEKFADAFNLTLNTLKAGKSVYFHCIWGADRTGCYAMLLEGLLGLTEDQLCKDYELTSYSHAGTRTKDGLDSKFNYIKSLPGETLQEQFYNYWHVQVGISKEDLLYFIEIMTDGHPAILDAVLPEYGVTPVVADGDYYIYLPAYEQFVGRGDNYGTRVVLDNYGVPAHFATSGFGVTTIKFLDSQLYLGSDVYTDKASDYNSINWTMEKKEGGFVLKSELEDKYLQMENDGKIRRSATTDENACVFTVKTLSDQKSIVAAKLLANKLAAASAAGLSATTLEAFNTELSTNYNAIPSTAVIKSANAGSTTDWILTQAGSQQDVWNAYNVGSYGAELYQKCGSTVSQTITVPHAGLYKLTLNALYRQGQNDRCYELGQAGYELSDAWVSVNGTYFAQIPSWYSDCASSSNPNNTDEAKALMDAGKYAIELYAYVGNDRQLTISINEQGYLAGSWCLFNNFALTEYAKKMTISETDTEAPAECEFADVTLTRTLKGGQWNGFSLPFSLSAAQLAASPLQDVAIKQFSSADGNVMTMTDATEIVAGEPYLVKPVNEDIVNPVFAGVTVENPEGAVKGDGDYKLAAHLYNTALSTDGDVAYVSTTDSSIKKLTSGGIKGLRSYFQIPTSNGVKALVLKFDNATEVETIDNVPFAIENEADAVFDISGRRVSKAHKGLYIRNGKKVLVK
ncbi:MAG: tyrosine-protein phosphatase [Bacteroidaceae bacterium]|nr:tyrosine-protein phosphatase [Bacteroidaceae bacterium]